MRVVTAAEIDALLTFPALVDALHEAFAGDIVTPARQHHEIGHGEDHATLLLMPAWNFSSPSSVCCMRTTSAPFSYTVMV